jgi:hypothetical protein
MRPGRIVTLCALSALLASGHVLAHGLLAQVRAEADAIVGTAYFSNGERAAGVWVELYDLTTTGPAIASTAAGSAGEFRFSGDEGRRYRVILHGDEGHRAEFDIALAPKAKGALRDENESATDAEFAPPAWAVLLALLGAATSVGFLLRRRMGDRVG